MTKYLNLKTSYGVETVDQLDRAEFNSYKEFRAELLRLRREYHIAGMGVYASSRATKEWREQT
jgi:hypothetical protein